MPNRTAEPAAGADAVQPAAIPPDVASQAVDWLLALSERPEGHPGAERARRKWQAWRAASPLHERAWQRIAQVDGRLREDLRGVPASVALDTLAAPGLARRRAVRLALLLPVGLGGLLAARQSDTWQQLAADLSTRTGERRETVLADGSRLTLGSATAVDLRYSGSERLIVLRVGEILLQSAADPAPDATTGMPRPLRVRTAEGTARAIGTRFTVRRQSGQTTVAVLRGEVELQTRDTPAMLRLHEGEQARFSETAIHDAEPMPAGAAAWASGMLVANDMRLGDFIAELARHRPGLLRCAPEAAELRVSGSYPLADTDRVLLALTRSLPVRISRRTRWWVVVERRGE